MSKSNFLQQQRKMVRAFHQVTTRLAETEADLESHLGEAAMAKEKTQATLAQIGLHDLLARAKPTLSGARSTDDPARELRRSTTRAVEAAERVQAPLQTLIRQQAQQQATWRSLSKIGAGLAVLSVCFDLGICLCLPKAEDTIGPQLLCMIPGLVGFLLGIWLIQEAKEKVSADQEDSPTSE